MNRDAIKKFVHKNTIIARAPGRINLIGEHTDYNEGFVLPGSINKEVIVAMTPRTDDVINLHSLDFHESVQTTLGQVAPVKKMWANYILGVVDQFKIAGAKLSGFDFTFHGEVPIGGGLSSSAAVECSTALALNKMLDNQFSPIELVKMARFAEHKFTGVKCGIMDQFASVFGRKNMVIKLDCRSLGYEYIPFEQKDIQVVLFDTNIKHSLASTEYNIRHKQCYDGVALIQQKFDSVKSLRDVSMDMLNEAIKNKNDVVYKRCQYVIGENERLLAACDDLKAGDMKAFGEKMYITHEALSKDYEVSCAELDFLVEIAAKETAILGARMMGGGFGGCTINLIKKDAVSELCEKFKKLYSKSMNRNLGIHIVSVEKGGSLISRENLENEHAAL